jgi:hypothetical protein
MCWPARLSETGEVLCISSADSHGNPSSFNPDSEMNSGRICTLGEGVPSCERDRNGNGKMVYRSGTSFATPIAAAIAAVVLGLMNREDLKDGPTDFHMLREKLKTKSGMEKVLRSSCVLRRERTRAGFSYITPWFFFSIQRNSRVHVIANELKDVLE